jgi:hypothetical protein
VRFLQNGRSLDGWTPPARGARTRVKNRRWECPGAAVVEGEAPVVNDRRSGYLIVLRYATICATCESLTADSGTGGMSHTGCRMSSSASS